jgi:formylglycine-generating enzyme required for sulfatase activity
VLNPHRLDATRHSAFLAEQRKDPVTRKAFHAGDEIVVCAACGSAFSVDSWNYLGGEHDGQSDTLGDIAQGPVTLRRRRFRMTNRDVDTTAEAQTHFAPPGLVPVGRTGFDFRVPLVVVVLLGVLVWLASMAVRPRVASEPDVSSQAASERASQALYEQQQHLEAANRARQIEEARLAAVAERSRVEEGLLGDWSDGSSRLVITKDGSNFLAEYRFPDSGPLSRDEGLQRLRGELLPNNELKLTNENYGKVTNPAENVPGAFSQEVWIELDNAGVLDVRFSEARAEQSLVMSRSLIGRVGDSRKGINSRDGLTYVWFPAGTFEMGCSSADGSRRPCVDDELPVHTVEISRGFWLGETLVPKAAYQQVTQGRMGAISGEEFAWADKWADADAYCQAVGMRLPTEAEWEYAARGEASGAPSAPATQDEQAAGGVPRTDYTGRYPPGPLGLRDLHGEVWQWVSDWYGAYGQGRVRDPAGPVDGRSRVLRGGYRGGVDRISMRGHSGGFLIWTEASRECSMIVGFRCAYNEPRSSTKVAQESKLIRESR